MQFNGMGYSAALAILLAAVPANMALAQSADSSAQADAGLTLVAQQQTYLDVMASLEAAGYTVVETNTTFLGRVQITARNATHLREVVVSRSTGEVKSDVILETFATGDATAGVLPDTAAPNEDETTTETGSLLDILGLGGTSVDAGADVSGSATVGSDSVGGSLSGGVSSGVSGATGGLSGGVSGRAGGSASGGGASASGGVSGGVSGGLGL